MYFLNCACNNSREKVQSKTFFYCILCKKAYFALPFFITNNICPNTVHVACFCVYHRNLKKWVNKFSAILEVLFIVESRITYRTAKYLYGTLMKDIKGVLETRFLSCCHAAVKSPPINKKIKRNK